MHRHALIAESHRMIELGVNTDGREGTESLYAPPHRRRWHTLGAPKSLAMLCKIHERQRLKQLTSDQVPNEEVSVAPAGYQQALIEKTNASMNLIN